MAYAALVSLSQTMEKLLHDQDSISLHEKQQIISTHDHIIFLKRFLEDFPERADGLEERIRDAASEAEDIIEYFMWNQIWWRNYTWKWVAAACESIKRWLHSDLRNLENLTKEINSIAKEAMEMKNSVGADNLQLSDASCLASCSSSSRLIIAPTSKDSAMVGFEDDLMAIKARLCGESSKLQVIPIFGMGGLGKTTLVRNAYDDPLTVEYFHIRAWVTVSQDYSAKEILSRLLVSIEAKSSEQGNESEMAENVYKRLKGKRYLVVMDDMWSTKAWDDVRKILPDDHNGSRIMLTTRLSDVAAYPDSCSLLHEMRFMDADESWSLLQQKVFCPPELEDIGKTIARSCRGLPLAIVVVAGLLSTISKTRASWENIARNVNKVVTRNDEQFAEIVLSSSYDHLPHHLRPCFIYMGCFPEDYEIHVSKLIKLWVAEGFLELRSGCKSCEEAAEEYLEDLVKRSLVLITRRKSNGKIKSCKLHDLVRDLCIRKSHQEKFFLKVMDRYASKVLLESIQNQRRLSIENSHLNFLEKIYGPTIRTIICFRRRDSDRLLIPFENFSLLRVLEMVNYNSWRNECEVYLAMLSCKWLPNQVLELFHLRYLSIDFPTKIPAAISELKNLQTLIIDPRSKFENHRSLIIDQKKTLRKYDRRVIYLPLEIWRMPQMRHLVAFTNCCLSDPEGETSALENLQTLSLTNFVCSESVVKMIPNLKKLGISYVVELCDKNFHLNNLVRLHHLEKLKLEVCENFPFREKLDHVFPRTLNRLTLSGWPLPWKDMGTFVGSLPNLEVLKLRDYACLGDTWETSEGEFCQLKFLLIEGSFIQQWITESSHFPRLKCLVLRLCWDLKEIPDGIGEISTLERIEIDRWNEPLVGSAKRIQEEQEQNWGNDALQVRIV